MDKKADKKARRRFNLIDAAIVLLALLVLAAIWLLRDRSTGVSATEYPMQLLIELNTVPGGSIELMQEGGEVYRATDNTYLGVIKSIESEPYTETKAVPALGTTVTYSPQENAYRVYLTVETSGYLTEKDAIISGSSCKIGDVCHVKGKGFAASGYIVGVDTMDAPAPEGSADSGTLRLTYTARIGAVRSFTADAVQLGDRLYDKTSNSFIGTVVDIEKTPYTTVDLNAEGESVTIVYADRYNVLLTIECLAVERPTGYWLGTAELKVGSTQQFYTRLLASSFNVQKLISIEAVD